jgi:hypothetical protein
MLNNGLDAASAAFEVGYESATQFNREYSRFFGQPPMRDVRALLSPGQASKDFRLLLIGLWLRNSKNFRHLALQGRSFYSENWRPIMAGQGSFAQISRLQILVRRLLQRWHRRSPIFARVPSQSSSGLLFQDTLTLCQLPVM